ncbi:LutC/YkgG family protein [Sciscionella marina]|uniref:LutC/YkgG family protein n=1 Tax=Sciscionella marina TaxID=508770 RepID=UPI000373D98F|nr:LUD domain-containing protein [Sciscionella marina]
MTGKTGTTGKATVLGRIRDALAIAPPAPVTVPRAYRTGTELPSPQRIALLAERLRDYRASVHECRATDTAATIARILGPARRIGCPAGLPRDWLAETGAEIRVDGPETSVAALDALDAVVTGSAVSCAETGTIFLDAGPDQGRRALTLVPDKHLCVVDASSVVAGVPEAIARLEPARPITLISGPSATSDIELERVEGVHGPRTLVVVLRTDR